MPKTITLAALVAAGAVAAITLTASPAEAGHGDVARLARGSNVRVIYHRDRHGHSAHEPWDTHRLLRAARRGDMACHVKGTRPHARSSRPHRFDHGDRRRWRIHMVRERVDARQLRRILHRDFYEVVHCCGRR